MKTFLKILGAVGVVGGLMYGFAVLALPTITYFNTNVSLKRALIDSASSTGSNTQVLSSTGTSTLWVNASAGGGSTPPGIVSTSTANYFTYYLTGTTVTGNSLMQLTAGTVTFTSTTNFSNISATGVTTTNLFYTLLQGTNANLTNVTTTNLFGTNVVFTNATSTNLSISGLTAIQGLTFTNATGTNLSISLGNFVNVTSTNVSSTQLYATNALFLNVSSTNLNLLTALGISSGGTNSSTISANGSIIYSDGTKYNASAVGTLGHIFMSAGATTPVWINSTTLNYLGFGYPALATSTFMPISASTSYNFQSPSITIASTSLQIGITTTIPIGPAVQLETWNFFSCYTDVASATVRFGGTAYMNTYNASSTGTTVPTTTVSSNNTFAAGVKRNIQIGGIVNMPNWISCSVSKRF